MRLGSRWRSKESPRSRFYFGSQALKRKGTADDHGTRAAGSARSCTLQDLLPATWRSARRWLAGAAAIVLMWWLDPSPLHGLGAAVTAAGRLAGLLGAYLVLVQLLLMGRLAWFEHAVGFDRLTAWHRGLGTNTVLLLVVHVLLIVEGYSLTDHQAITSTGWRVLSTYPSMLSATAGLLLFGLVAVTSARAARRRLTYEEWYAVHLSAYAAVALAFSHQIAAGQDFVGHPINQALWWGLYLFVAAELVRGRVLLPIRAWFRHRMLVERVVVESPGVVSVWVRGRRLDELGAEAGQFLLWRFLAPGHVWSAHPYSLSAAPDHGRLRITVKDAGDHSAALAHLRPGHPGDRRGAVRPLHAGQERELTVVADRRGLRHRSHQGIGRGAPPARQSAPPRCGAAVPGRARPGPGPARRARPTRPGGRATRGLPARAPLRARARPALSGGDPVARPRRAFA